jgi:hypothetical protein
MLDSTTMLDTVLTIIGLVYIYTREREAISDHLLYLHGADDPDVLITCPPPLPLDPHHPRRKIRIISICMSLLIST